MAKVFGPFEGFADNREHMLRVMRNHSRAAHGEASGYEQLNIAPLPLDAENCPQRDLVDHARAAWDVAVTMGEQYGYRNAQASVIAPTGTIGLVLVCVLFGFVLVF